MFTRKAYSRQYRPYLKSIALCLLCLNPNKVECVTTITSSASDNYISSPNISSSSSRHLLQNRSLSDTCSQYTSCTTCNNNNLDSLSCHWCDSDFTCHEDGSWDSCWIRPTCLENHPCVRNEPQRVGMTSRRTVYMSGTVIFVVASLVWMIYWETQGPSMIVKVLNFLLVLVTVVGFLFAVLFPQDPIVEICTGRTAWRSIIDNIRQFNLNASFRMLLSMYNPNVVGVIITKGTGSFLFNNIPFGSFQLETPINLNKVSVTDLLVQVTFEPRDFQTLNIVSAYALGVLKFTVDAELELALPFLRNFSFSYMINDYDVDLTSVTTALSSNATLCQCALF